MKRFHVHVTVQDLARSVQFYSGLFGAAPTRQEADYAKWMLEDPRVNFAISTRGATPGLDHLGLQTDSDEELAELKARAKAADFALKDEGETTCCYARSDKYWVQDPQGIAWEQFHTLGNIPVFSEKAPVRSVVAAPCCANEPAQPEAAGCAPSRGKPVGVAVKSANACC